VVTETDKLLRRLLGEHVVLTTVLGPGLRPILADPGQITQVLMNLAINARDAMPRGGSLQITTRAAGREVVLILADTGSGMTEAVRARVFEPFFTTKSAGLGTGLGLSVTHGIISQSGGRIVVESAPGRGTTFTIHLPVADRKAIRSATHAVVGDLRGTETLLVVEDQDAVRRGIVRILRSRGYRVMEANDGLAALLTLETYGDAIDLVVTDMVMPEMGGRELAETAALRWPDLPFLFTTGYTTEAVIKRGELQTEIPFLYKPFNADSLLSRVRGVLNA
jgi:CheY-like chemotaxis protein